MYIIIENVKLAEILDRVVSYMSVSVTSWNIFLEVLD
jgi:hypothetical protein